MLPGSLLWPVLSGGAYDFWGTAGPRLIALLLIETMNGPLIGRRRIQRTASKKRRWSSGSDSRCNAVSLAKQIPFR